jgi:predicted DNA-binding transcriptional regulator YafY
VTLLAYSLEWLAYWVYSFGVMAEVLAPEKLKQLVALEATQVASKYRQNRSTSLRKQPVQPVPS